LNAIIPANIIVYQEKVFYEKNPNDIENTILTKGRILFE